MPETAIVAALEREIRPLVKSWRKVEREYDGRRFQFFESDGAVAVCGGIGAEPARRATEAIITLYRPVIVKSVGFAGALDPGLRVGDTFVPGIIIDARDGTRFATSDGKVVLLTTGSVASVVQKRKLAAAYSAQAVDMEAAAVEKGAQAHGIRFSAVKAISDEVGFEVPDVTRWISKDGQLHQGRLAVFVMMRPWLWARFLRLSSNSAKAARALCSALSREVV